MYILGFIVLIIAFGVGLMVYIAMKSPKLTPKKVIVETILEANDVLFRYRQEVRSLLADGFGLYQQHDAAAFATRHSTSNSHGREIAQKLEHAENTLAPYEKVKAEKQFYDLASATIETLRQAANRIGELQSESAGLEAIITQLQSINTLTQDANMTAYIADDDTVVASRVTERITTIFGLIRQTTAEVSALKFQTNEFQGIARSIAAVLQQAEQDYVDLRGLLSSGQYEEYRNKNMSVASFFARFDMSSYESIATTAFSYNPEDSFINDLRSHLYS